MPILKIVMQAISVLVIGVNYRLIVDIKWYLLILLTPVLLIVDIDSTSQSTQLSLQGSLFIFPAAVSILSYQFHSLSLEDTITLACT